MYKQITTCSEPNIIGVNNGIYQIVINEEVWNKNEQGVSSLINLIDVNEFLENQEKVLNLDIKHIEGQLIKNAIPTDLMGFSPFIFGFKYVVSEQFVNCLLEEDINRNEFSLFEIKIKDLKNFYLFFVPMIQNSHIDFNKSRLYPEREMILDEKERNYIQVSTHEEYLNLIQKNMFLRWDKICLADKYANNSIINIQGISNLFFSDSLVEKLESSSLTNINIKNDIELSFGNGGSGW